MLTIDDLNEKELKKIRKRSLEYKLTVLSEWPRTLLDGLIPYKKPQLVNAGELINAIS